MVLGLLCFEVVSPKPNTTIKNRKEEIKKKKKNRSLQLKGKAKEVIFPDSGFTG